MVEERTGSTWSVTQLYRLDKNGNRTRLITSTGATDAAYDGQEHLLSWGDRSYTTSLLGQRTTRTTPTETHATAYDAFGTLQSFTRTPTVGDPTVLTYRNDALGRRIERHRTAPSDPTQTTRWLYADALNPLAELRSVQQGPFELRQRYLYGFSPHVPDALLEGAGQSAVPYRVVSDHLGSVRLVVRADTTSCQVVQRIDYDAFGVVTGDSSPGFQPFGFAGGLKEVDSGLVRFGARDYDPEVGRWTSGDPIGFEGGWNLALYAEGDPVDFIDPTGKWIGVAVGVVALGAGYLLGHPNSHDPATDRIIRDRIGRAGSANEAWHDLYDERNDGQCLPPQYVNAEHYAYGRKLGEFPFFGLAAPAVVPGYHGPKALNDAFGMPIDMHTPGSDGELSPFEWDQCLYGMRGAMDGALDQVGLGGLSSIGVSW